MKSAFISIIGRANVGKSTLLNAIVGEKVAIVSDKPQTTRDRIIGLYNTEDTQLVFVDTPGFHTPRNKLGEHMIRAAQEAMDGVDAILLVAECRAPGKIEKDLIEKLKMLEIPTILVLNKIDIYKKEEIAASIQAYATLFPFHAVVPISAMRKDGVRLILEELAPFAEEVDDLFYPTDIATDRTERRLAADLIREKLLRNLNDEIPHGTAVEIVMFRDREDKDLTDVFANIICERESHKGIIIGKGGSMLKKAASQAREDLEKMLGRKVYLECRVKVKEDWRNNERLINEYNEYE